jgi:hypothetical protein
MQLQHRRDQPVPAEPRCHDAQAIALQQLRQRLLLAGQQALLAAAVAAAGWRGAGRRSVTAPTSGSSVVGHAVCGVRVARCVSWDTAVDATAYEGGERSEHAAVGRSQTPIHRPRNVRVSCRPDHGPSFDRCASSTPFQERQRHNLAEMGLLIYLKLPRVAAALLQASTRTHSARNDVGAACRPCCSPQRCDSTPCAKATLHAAASHQAGACHLQQHTAPRMRRRLGSTTPHAPARPRPTRQRAPHTQHTGSPAHAGQLPQLA